jgi:DNA-binding transcriptional MerR regulator
MALIKITDLTNQLGISSRSLRFYEQAGLIKSTRPELEKYRFYDRDNVERIKQIMVLRKMQIPVKDILRIYESENMSVVVETFVSRIHAIDREIGALSELKRIVNDFLKIMMQNGVTKISALPLLYEEMDRKLELLEEDKPVTYDELNEISETLKKPVDISIVDLPPMRVLSSKQKESGISDVEAFWDYLNTNDIPSGLPGRHELFEYQDALLQSVLIQKIDSEFINRSPFEDYQFEGGLFAVGSVYADEDIGEFHRNMIESFDTNLFYEVDYRHGGGMRHESLIETIISPDDKREKVNVLLAVKKRLPDTSLYTPTKRIEEISLQEIEKANSVLYKTDVALDKLIPIYDPYYHVNENGEAEYIGTISPRFLSTGVEVKLPFRVDMEFKYDTSTAAFGYGADEGNIRIYHGTDMSQTYGVNMENSPDSRLSAHAITFNQPVFKDLYRFPQIGSINENEYNQLTWIVGEEHLAVIINGEVRYCGVNFPYMSLDLQRQKAQPICVGSNGSGKFIFRSIRVTQLRVTPKIKAKEGDLIMITKQSNNILPNIHRINTGEYGENYWFNGCASYVMECLKEPDYDYWFFSGLTGDNLAQVYSYKEYMGECVTGCLYSDGDSEYFENICDKCGYASTFVSTKQLLKNKNMYVQTLMAYIDKGIPVIAFTKEGPPWGVYVGYEEHGNVLLFLAGDKSEPEHVQLEKAISDKGWIFVGEKKSQPKLAQTYREVIADMPRLFSVKTDNYCFGSEAFYAWAEDLEQGKLDIIKPEEFDDWGLHVSSICNMATNGSCLAFFERAQELNPDLTFLADVRKLYQRTAQIWNNDKGEDLEALGAGFNVTLEALQDKENRIKIAAKIREAGACMDSVIDIIKYNMKIK